MSRGCVGLLAASLALGTALGPRDALASLRPPLLVVVGDFDGDGQTDRVQGFPDASEGAGRVDVFWGAPTFRVAWPTELSAIKDPATRLASGRLGESLAVGDFNGDHLDDLAIGVPQSDTSLIRPNQRPELIASTGSVVVILGCPATRCPAVDSHGAGTPAVGSPLDPSSGAGALRILPTQPIASGRFGKSLAAGDFDADGFDDLAIGSPGDSVGDVPGAGSVTIVYGSSRGLDLSRRQRLDQQVLSGGSAAEADDHFGAALGAARLDFDGDHDLVIGVPDEDYGDAPNVESNAGEVDVVWGGPGGLSTSNHDSFRHTLAMTGGSRSGDRLGYDLRSLNNLIGIPGALLLGLAEATTCGGRRGFLTVPSDVLGTADPSAPLTCDVDICDSNTPGDGSLPEIPVNFIVLANADTGAIDLPTETAHFNDPITGGDVVGEGYFKSMVDLLNQQLRADDGNPICVEKDCLRLAYGGADFYSPELFSIGNIRICPLLEAIARPNDNALRDEALAYTTNCDSTNCPALIGGGGRYASYSDFAEAAVDECGVLLDQHALNVVLYDECERDPGDVLDCRGSTNGRARVNPSPIAPFINHPYMFVDTARALKPRLRGVASPPAAAEEHEAGHAFGLDHACETPADAVDTHVMQTGACCLGLGARNRGFATVGRLDVTDLETQVVEVRTMILTARDHIKDWQCQPPSPPPSPAPGPVEPRALKP